MRKRIAMMAIIGIVGLIFMSPVVHAADPVQLINVTPSSTTISVDPGKNTKGSVDVINLGKNAFDVTLVSSPYRVQGLDYSPEFTQLPGTVDPSKWVHFITPTVATVQPQKLLAADYTVDVPAGTASGGYYAVIFAEIDTAASTQSSVVTHSRVGDILYITVNGAVKTAGTVKTITTPTIITSTPVPLNVIVANQGGVHFQTTVDTVVKNLFGKSTFSYRVNAYILPQTQRELSTKWTPQAPIGIYQITRSTSLPNTANQEAKQWVLVVKPWVIIVLIAIIVVIVILILRGIGRGRRQRQHENKED
jgi:hypothetical protein